MANDRGAQSIGGLSYRQVREVFGEAFAPRNLIIACVGPQSHAQWCADVTALLGRLDGLAFTAGIGEHSPTLRAAVLNRLGLLGMRVDPGRNEEGPAERVVTTQDSAVPAWVVPTNEELEIARQAVAVLR